MAGLPFKHPNCLFSPLRTDWVWTQMIHNYNVWRTKAGQIKIGITLLRRTTKNCIPLPRLYGVGTSTFYSVFHLCPATSQWTCDLHQLELTIPSLCDRFSSSLFVAQPWHEILHPSLLPDHGLSKEIFKWSLKCHLQICLGIYNGKWDRQIPKLP